MKTNTKTPSTRTHEGATAKHINAEQQLRRSVLSCLLFEKEFYEDGATIAARIKALVPKVDPLTVANLAVEARSDFHLRHVPLLLVREMARTPSHRFLVADTLFRVIQRADELSEFVAIYWKAKKQPLSAQVKKGLARAFTKFDEYQLAKYNRKALVTLKDVMRLMHPKPIDKDQEAMWKRLLDDELATPDTWETSLSSDDGGELSRYDKWTRLLSENRLGGLALLRNLRNMIEAKVSEELIREALADTDMRRVLPFRFIAAARYVPQLEDALEATMLKNLRLHDPLRGVTTLLVDVSGSMNYPLSRKSDMSRMEAACALAILLREISDSIQIVTFSEHNVRVAPRHGFALRDAIVNSQRHWSTMCGAAVQSVAGSYDRLIVITDEQSHDRIPDPDRGTDSYMINVASDRNGVGYGPWTHIDGMSEAVVDYIQRSEHYA